jgi:hypothetical protein
MVYSKIAIRPDSGLLASIYLNKEFGGWVGQIIGGTFGSNTEYNFTGNVVTTVTDKPIDINVRLTPTVPAPKTAARYYLNTLSNGKDFTVSLTEDVVQAPSILYKYNETTTYTKPSILFNRNVIWKQTCVIREIKYNYSESPATIEFTITTKQPTLYGPDFSIYAGFGNQNWAQAIDDVASVFDKINSTIGYVDISRLRIGLPPVGNTSWQIFNQGLTQFHANVVGSSTTENGLFEMTKTDTGGRLFNITGGYQPLSATCYASEAYPAFPAPDIMAFLKALRPPAKFNIPNYGSCYVAMDLQMVRKGL